MELKLLPVWYLSEVTDKNKNHQFSVKIGLNSTDPGRIFILFLA
jgi:hypothetical protein